MCWFITELLNTRGVKDVGYDALVALRGHCSVKLKQICLRIWYYSMKHASWSIGNQREKLLDRCPFFRLAISQCEIVSAKTATLSIQHICREESSCVAAAATYMPAGCLTCLLIECCCKMDCGHSISMRVDLFSLFIGCLLVVCFSICYICW